MERKPHIGKAIAVFSATALLLTAACFTGRSQARYQNYSQWRGVYAPQQTGLSSDRLTAGGQKILLNSWTVEDQVSHMKGITLSTAAGTVTGTVACVADCPEYLTVAMDRDTLTVDPAGVHTQLIMTPTQNALLLTEAVTATVRVTFTPEGEEEPALWADYQIELLPPVAEETQPEAEPAAELTPDTLNISSPDTFAWAEALALQITAPDQADTLILGMNGGDFPEGTRYILNETACLLGEDMQIEAVIPGGEKAELLLDFSLLNQPEDPITLQAQTLYGQEVTAAKEWTVAATREAMFIDTSASDLVLTGSTELKLPICTDTSETVWRLEMLTDTENGIAYTQSDEQFYLVITISEETDENGAQKFITISNAGGTAPAGTYRLTLERLYEEQILSSTQVQFFLCY